MKSRLVIGVPSDHFHDLSVMVILLSPLLHTIEEYRLSWGLMADAPPSPSYTRFGHSGMVRFAL